jgi:hypothetical protein
VVTVCNGCRGSLEKTNLGAVLHHNRTFTLSNYWTVTHFHTPVRTVCCRASTFVSAAVFYFHHSCCRGVAILRIHKIVHQRRIIERRVNSVLGCWFTTHQEPVTVMNTSFLFCDHVSVECLVVIYLVSSTYHTHIQMFS